MPFVEAPDGSGARISYEDAGSGPAVILVQGVGVVGNGWRPQVEGLRDRFRLLTFDNRGIGASTLGTAPLTIEAMAADAWAVAGAAGVERAHVVGHSMGGVIAQAMALARPERVASLGLLCTFAHGRQAASLTAGMMLVAMRTRLGTRAMRRAAFLDMVLPRAELARADRAELAARLAPLFGHDLADQPPIIMKQLRAMSRYDGYDRLAALAKIPTLVLSGAEDRIARPAYGRELAAGIPGARFEELPGAAHGVTIHDAPAVNERLAALFASA
jgi:pimeloyl-ACP methyl ester carboxylesterase